jgi:hypothetical protein
VTTPPALTKSQVRKIVRTNPNAALYIWHGQVYLDDGEAVQMISPSILCALNVEGVIAPTDPQDASIWLAR